ncbi:MAG: GTP cyclohydrolase I FolE [Bacteroidales bacterium]|nr:GTP cyclohydrolase I FolE [Bacteroidales bacterium]
MNELSENIKHALQLLGEDTDREGLQKTPERVAKCMLKFTSGYSQDPKEVLLSAVFEEDYTQPVVIRDIEFYSLCEHHLLPFFGKVHVAYIPDGRIVGLSKIPRVVEVFARRLQVQERMTSQICQCINETLHPKGVMVMVEAQHLCMQMRGIEKQGAVTVTSNFTGVYQDATLRAEFYNQLKG